MLTGQHLNERLLQARDIADRILEDKQNVASSHESQFQLLHADVCGTDLSKLWTLVDYKAPMVLT